MVNQQTIFAGTSGGSIAALVACLNIAPEEAMEILARMAQRPGILLEIDLALKEALHATLQAVSKQRQHVHSS